MLYVHPEHGESLALAGERAAGYTKIWLYDSDGRIIGPSVVKSSELQQAPIDHPVIEKLAVFGARHRAGLKT